MRQSTVLVPATDHLGFAAPVRPTKIADAQPANAEIENEKATETRATPSGALISHGLGWGEHANPTAGTDRR